MAAQVAGIVALTEREHYAGIDLDYENLHAGDRQAFTTFVTRLARALHARGKVLSVAVFAKTTNAGTDPRNVAQDYAAIGRAADQVRLMAYDYHWDSSPPGPVAPISWVRAVLRYARTQIPASKIILGVPLYGYDWVGHHGTGISWLQALRLSRQYHATAHYDQASQAPWFRYRDAAGHEHTVWFENAASSRAKFDAAQGAQIGGVYLWMYGYEDAGHLVRAGPRAADIRPARAQHLEGGVMMPWWVLVDLRAGRQLRALGDGWPGPAGRIAGRRRRPGRAPAAGLASTGSASTAGQGGDGRHGRRRAMAAGRRAARTGRPRSTARGRGRAHPGAQRGPGHRGEPAVDHGPGARGRTSTWCRTAPPTPRSRSPGGRRPGDRDPGERGQGRGARGGHRPVRPDRAVPGGHAARRRHPGRARLLHRRAAHVRRPAGGRRGRLRADRAATGG